MTIIQFKNKKNHINPFYCNPSKTNNRSLLCTLPQMCGGGVDGIGENMPNERETEWYILHLNFNNLLN